MGLRRLARRIRRHMRRNHPAVVVASMGRAGSTLVFEALSAASDMRPDPSFLPELAGARFEPGAVYKTHDYPDALEGVANLRVVFVFGSASEAARSVFFQERALGREWIRKHLAHLKAERPFEALFDEDILRIGDQLDAWTGCPHTPVLSLRFDALWDNVDILRRFTGLRVRLPARRPRRPKPLPPELEARCAATYGPLDRRIAAMPPVILSGPRVL